MQCDDALLGRRIPQWLRGHFLAPSTLHPFMHPHNDCNDSPMQPSTHPPISASFEPFIPALINSSYHQSIRTFAQPALSWNLFNGLPDNKFRLEGISSFAGWFCWAYFHPSHHVFCRPLFLRVIAKHCLHPRITQDQDSRSCSSITNLDDGSLRQIKITTSRSKFKSMTQDHDPREWVKISIQGHNLR